MQAKGKLKPEISKSRTRKTKFAVFSFNVSLTSFTYLILFNCSPRSCRASFQFSAKHIYTHPLSVFATEWTKTEYHYLKKLPLLCRCSQVTYREVCPLFAGAETWDHLLCIPGDEQLSVVKVFQRKQFLGGCSFVSSPYYPNKTTLNPTEMT